jgi:imidazole glycerol-phosphate synthase subunit HisH
MKIGVIDYGMGNLFSVEQALKRLQLDAFVTSDIAQLEAADALILPGVGAFPDAMKRLQETDLIDLITKTKKPLLGICLGMQLMFEDSEEVAKTKGLGIFKGSIERFTNVSRIPHMGWNNLELTKMPSFLDGKELPKERHVYFVHSFLATDFAQEQLVAFADYEGVKVPGIVAKDNFTGMQFHPEKSGTCGMFLLEQWVKKVGAVC